MAFKTIFEKNKPLPDKVKFTNNLTGKSIILRKKQDPTPEFVNGRIRRINPHKIG